MCAAYGGTDGTLYAAGGLKAPLLLPDHAHDVVGQSLLNLRKEVQQRLLSASSRASSADATQAAMYASSAACQGQEQGSGWRDGREFEPATTNLRCSIRSAR